jgi:uncharacterized protein (DUF1501 family)
MDTVTRRRFLIASGVTAGAALAVGATTIGLTDLLNGGETRDPDARILVLVTLYGGNDGLNTVVPAGDRTYQSERPGLAYKEEEVLPLGDGLGLNPSMKGFARLWKDHKLAVVRGVSYPKPDRSHFRSMAIWQTAAPASPVPTGWLGRWLDATGGNPLHGISIGATLPPMLAGATVAGAALPLTGIKLPARLRIDGLAKPDKDDGPDQARAASSLADLRGVEQAFGTVLADPGTGNAGELAAQLDVVARCIAANAPTRVYAVSLSGFDTHAGEKTTQSALLAQLDTAVASFLAKAPANVVVAVYSEFGRRVAANANQGTDHGTAGPVFIAGKPVTGGFYGDEPSLTKLVDGDLVATTDFRDVYATLVDRVLGSDPEMVLPGYKPRDIGFL